MKKGKAGRVYSLTEKGERYFKAWMNFVAELEKIEKEVEAK